MTIRAGLNTVSLGGLSISSHESIAAGPVTRLLYTAVVADALDELGIDGRVMSDDLRPINPSAFLSGRALTVSAVDVAEAPTHPYLRELQAVDALGPGDVVVIANRGTNRCGLWGELLTTAALSKGGTGAIIDGLVRDGNAVVGLDFPVFSRGFSPLDSKGRCDVSEVGSPIVCGGVRVVTGDLIFGDRDGIVVVPSAAADEILARASAKASQERSMHTALQKGMGIIEAYDRYGVL